MTWHRTVGTKGLSKGLRASGPKGLEPNYYLNLNHCTGYTALLKALHSHCWWDALPCCYDPNWL